MISFFLQKCTIWSENYLNYFQLEHFSSLIAKKRGRGAASLRHQDHFLDLPSGNPLKEYQCLTATVMVSRPQSSSLAKKFVIPNLHPYRSIAKWVSKRLKSTPLVRAMFANRWRTDATTLFSLSLLILLLPCKGALHFPCV